MMDWIVSSSVLIVLVIALRGICKGKINLRLQYALWGLVLVRLLLPISFGNSNISVANGIKAVNTQVVLEHITPENHVVTPTQPSQPIIPVTPQISPKPTVEHTNADSVEVKDTVEVSDILIGIWVVGAVIVGIWFLYTNLRFGKMLRRTRTALTVENCPRPVYVCENLDTPCLFGLFRPAIYLTPEVVGDETLLHHTLAHELTHHRHGDHIWAPLRGLCLALHWYNPLVWWGAILSSRDGELACDEGTIRNIGEEERAQYGRTLIAMTCQKRTDLLLAATTMTGSKGSIKERITRIAKKPKMAIYTLMAVVIVATMAVGCTFTGANQEEALVRYEHNGYTMWVESDLYDKLIFKEDISDDDIALVCEKRSYEESVADWGEDSACGFLFGVRRYTQAQLEYELTVDMSGLAFFAKDDSYYYAKIFATDVQMYHTDVEAWQALEAEIPTLLSSFMEENGLTPFDLAEIFSEGYTYEGDHLFLNYYPYAVVNGSQDEYFTLVLSQPATQGDGGIWCVERFTDQYENVYAYFPIRGGETDLPAREYYAQQQIACDNGTQTELLDPMAVAAAFVSRYFDQAVGEDSFEWVENSYVAALALSTYRVTATYGKEDANYNDPDAYHPDSRATLTVYYPQISDTTTAQQDNINRLLQELCNGWMYKAPEWLTQSEEPVTTSTEVTYEVTRNDGQCLSLRFDFLTTETGSPYPVNTGVITRNYNLSANILDSLNVVEGIFLPEDESALLDLMIQSQDYEQYRDIITEEQLGNELFRGAVYLTDTELVIAFDEGCLGPHALGTPTFHISLEIVEGQFPNFMHNLIPQET